MAKIPTYGRATWKYYNQRIHAYVHICKYVFHDASFGRADFTVHSDLLALPGEKGARQAVKTHLKRKVFIIRRVIQAA